MSNVIKDDGKTLRIEDLDIVNTENVDLSEAFIGAESASEDNVKGLSCVISELSCVHESKEEDEHVSLGMAVDLPSQQDDESRSQSAEPLTTPRHVSDPNASISPPIPPYPRRQVRKFGTCVTRCSR